MTIELWFKPSEKIAGGGRIDIMYRLKGGGRPHITFNRGGILFGCYVATKAVEFQVISTYKAENNKVYSGPQAGEKFPPLKVIGITGKLDGKEFDIVEVSEGEPLIIFLQDDSNVGLKGLYQFAETIFSIKNNVNMQIEHRIRVSQRRYGEFSKIYQSIR